MKPSPKEIIQSLAAIENFNLQNFGLQNEKVDEMNKSHILQTITENEDVEPLQTITENEEVEPKEETKVTKRPLMHFKRLEIPI